MKSPKSPYRHYKQHWSKHAPLVGVTVLVTLAASNLLGGQLPGIPQGAAAQRQDDQLGLYMSQGADAQGHQDDDSTVPQWQLPVEWRQKVRTGCRLPAPAPCCALTCATLNRHVCCPVHIIIDSRKGCIASADHAFLP